MTCPVGTCNGFIANRIMDVSIDEASEDYGMKMDPFRMNDLVGLDFFGCERANSGAATPDTVVMDALYAAGRFGQKNGKGSACALMPRRM